MIIVHSKTFFKTVKVLAIIGFSLCVGSIASFIAMNMIAGKNPTIEFLYWQRTFVNPIMNYVTIPGIWLFLIGNIGLFFTAENKRNKINILFLLLSILVVINGQAIIIPIAKTVSQMAVEQFQTGKIINEFSSKKSMEDSFGGINLLSLLIYLTVYILKEKKQHNSASR